MRRVQTMNWWLVVVGLLVAVAPFAFGFNGIAAALWTFLVVGLAVAVLAGISASRRGPSNCWTGSPLRWV